MGDGLVCDRCGAALSAAASFCARCGETCPPPTSVAAAGATADFVDCVYCAEPIRPKARACRFCGHVVGTPVEAKPLGADMRRAGDHVARVALGEVKSPLLAALLSLVCPGLGQAYAGCGGRGLAILSAFFSAFFLLFTVARLLFYSPPALVALYGLATFALYLWQIADAWNSIALRRGDAPRRTDAPPSERRATRYRRR